ncbi:hypothetical protein Baya_3485 [Bagarius yarrelli]|uniref:Uncharacterized protein n=1 Tax=Bagarius yarrelli TaxID=175774 RepID=A0A556TPC8_BAGYA|nr:hypothetical protein Baya_3485 [Bagarius yarrelli]
MKLVHMRFPYQLQGADDYQGASPVAAAHALALHARLGPREAPRERRISVEVQRGGCIPLYIHTKPSGSPAGYSRGSVRQYSSADDDHNRTSAASPGDFVLTPSRPQRVGHAFIPRERIQESTKNSTHEHTDINRQTCLTRTNEYHMMCNHADREKNIERIKSVRGTKRAFVTYRAPSPASLSVWGKAGRLQTAGFN